MSRVGIAARIIALGVSLGLIGTALAVIWWPLGLLYLGVVGVAVTLLVDFEKLS